MSQKPQSKVALIIPTLNGGSDFKRLLESLEKQLQPLTRKIVVDSSSDDETPILAKEKGFEVLSIQRKDFNHGKTRQEAVEHVSDCDIAIFLTQDTCCYNEETLAKIVTAFEDPEVAIAYGRQVPYDHHNLLAQHARFFNYPASSHQRSLKDKERYGIKTAFSSNAFAAYRIQSLIDLGGFPSKIILGEDVFVAAKALLSDQKIAYVSEACVVHSHDFSLIQEFKSYFDYGVFHKQEDWIINSFAAVNATGFNYAFSELKFLMKKSPTLLPLSVMRSACKWLAYNLGKRYSLFSKATVKKLSRHPSYWN
ncbi:MAG: glycosyltransferase [Chlamydiales bacterium]|nr:glycosyltransferase [Chlamydiales bacterium]NCF70254.1 glycosyltransferase [Chlamydiales bacterium]